MAIASSRVEVYLSVDRNKGAVKFFVKCFSAFFKEMPICCVCSKDRKFSTFSSKNKKQRHVLTVLNSSHVNISTVYLEESF